MGEATWESEQADITKTATQTTTVRKKGVKIFRKQKHQHLAATTDKDKINCQQCNRRQFTDVCNQQQLKLQQKENQHVQQEQQIKQHYKEKQHVQQEQQIKQQYHDKQHVQQEQQLKTGVLGTLYDYNNNKDNNNNNNDISSSSNNNKNSNNIENNNNKNKNNNNDITAGNSKRNDY